MQTMDQEDEESDFSEKHVAAARFLRNHRLVNDILSDSLVPDVRSVVTTNRMQVLKRQVSSLTMHQQKLQTELQQIQDKFEAKKKRFLEASAHFQEEMKTRCALKPVDNEAYQRMLDKALEQIKAEKQLEDKKREEASRLAEVNGKDITPVSGQANDPDMDEDTIPDPIESEDTEEEEEKTDEDVSLDSVETSQSTLVEQPVPVAEAAPVIAPEVAPSVSLPIDPEVAPAITSEVAPQVAPSAPLPVDPPIVPEVLSQESKDQPISSEDVQKDSVEESAIQEPGVLPEEDTRIGQQVEPQVEPQVEAPVTQPDPEENVALEPKTQESIEEGQHV